MLGAASWACGSTAADESLANGAEHKTQVQFTGATAESPRARALAKVLETASPRLATDDVFVVEGRGGEPAGAMGPLTVSWETLSVQLRSVFPQMNKHDLAERSVRQVGDLTLRRFAFHDGEAEVEGSWAITLERKDGTLAGFMVEPPAQNAGQRPGGIDLARTLRRAELPEEAPARSRLVRSNDGDDTRWLWELTYPERMISVDAVRDQVLGESPSIYHATLDFRVEPGLTAGPPGCASQTVSLWDDAARVYPFPSDSALTPHDDDDFLTTFLNVAAVGSYFENKGHQGLGGGAPIRVYYHLRSDGRFASSNGHYPADGCGELYNAWFVPTARHADSPTGPALYFGHGGPGAVVTSRCDGTDQTSVAPMNQSFDVVAHEFTHAVLYDQGIECKYSWFSNHPHESCALHESLSDIYAKLAFYGNSSIPTSNWEFRTAVDATGNGQGFRDLADPGSRCDETEYTGNLSFPYVANPHRSSTIVSQVLVKLLKIHGAQVVEPILWGAIGALGTYPTFAELRDAFLASCNAHQPFFTCWGMDSHFNAVGIP